MELSVIIPAYNEEKRLGKSILVISEYLKKRYNKYEIIIVDDGSLDKTPEVINDLRGRIPELEVLQNPKNMGKGYSVKRGILKSSSELVLFSDADLSTPIEELQKLKNAIEENYDIAIGSRACPEATILKRQSRLREYMGKIFNLFVRMIVMGGIKDTQCGFKLFKRKAALDLFRRQKINGFSFDAEILYMAKKLGYRIKSVPVTWINSPNTRVRLLSSSLDMFFTLGKIKAIHKDL